MAHRIYGNRDPREIPAYPLVEAARYASVPLSTLRDWIGEVIELPDESDGQLSFYNRVESAGDIVNVSRGGQVGIQSVLAGVLQRVEKGPTGARRLFPLTRADIENRRASSSSILASRSAGRSSPAPEFRLP